MTGYIIRRTLYIIPTILGVAFLVFILFSVAGEDPVRLKLGNHATPEAIQKLRSTWGFDKPLFPIYTTPDTTEGAAADKAEPGKPAPLPIVWEEPPAEFVIGNTHFVYGPSDIVKTQFGSFLWQIVTFDYGRSFSDDRKLSESFADGAVVSLSLTLPPFVMGLMLFIVIAMTIAYYREKFLDRSMTALTVMMLSVSYLVYILAFQYLFTFKFEWFPTGWDEDEYTLIGNLMLPWLIFMVTAAGRDVRIFRTVFLDEIGADYVRTARAKGVSEPGVLFGHVLKNAMIPILTYTVVAIPFLILGSFLMEKFFSIPGLGRMLIDAINKGDFAVLKGLTMYIAIGYSVFNLLTDVLYAFVDPRVKLS